jgi:hypothetical protein
MTDAPRARTRSRAPATPAPAPAPAEAPATENAPGDNSEEQPAAPRTIGRITAGTGGQIGGRAGAGTPAATGGSDDAWMKTGAGAREAVSKELEQQQDKERKRAEGIYMPYRFWLPVGKQVEVVVLDAEPGPCFYEHQLQNPQSGKWDTYESCPKEFDLCPLCDGTAGGKDSYYIMLLTVIVLDPYVNSKGITVPHSRKLLAVKSAEQPFFLRQFDRDGSLRGLHLLMTRDTKNMANHGRPEFIAKHSEEDVMASFGHAAVTAQDGKVLKQANADCFAFPYGRIFTKPSGEDLRRRYGGTAPIGSRQERRTEFANGATTGGFASGVDDDDVPF